MTQRGRVLQALRAAGSAGVTNGQLHDLGVWRYSARIHELREEGYTIRTVNGKDGLATFFLEAEPQTASPSLSPPPSAGGGEQTLFDAPPVAVSAVTGRPVA